MAEKEERTLIQIEQSNTNGEWGVGEGAKVWQCTRAEAIEKMAKAIATPYFEGVFSCENEAIEEYAKAALNALLGE